MWRLSTLQRIFLLIVIALVATPSSAQPAGQAAPRPQLPLGIGVPLAFYTKSLLIEYQPVRQELELTAKQKARLQEIQRTHEDLALRQLQVAREDRNAIRQERDPQVKADLEEFFREKARKDQSQLSDQMEAARLAILDRRQRDRLDQIQIQAEGLMAFRRPEIQKRLNLDPAQVRQIDAIIQEGHAEFARISERSDVPRLPKVATREARLALQTSKPYQAALELLRQQVLTLRMTVLQRIVARLTDQQQEAYWTLCGAPFDSARLRAPDAEATSEPAKEAKAP